MKSMLRHLFVVCVALTLVCGINAADKKKKKPAKGKRNPGAAIFSFPKKIELNAEQKEKLAALKKEYQEKFAAALKASTEGLTAEQKEAMAKARKEAVAAGKKGKELAKAVRGAVEISKEQRKAMGESRKALATLRKEIEGKKLAILTDEQKELIKKKKPKNNN